MSKGSLIELLRLLLNPTTLVSSDAGASAEILGALLPSSKTPAANGEGSTPSVKSSGKRVALSSMVVTAASKDPHFLQRVGLADRPGTISKSSVVRRLLVQTVDCYSCSFSFLFVAFFKIKIQ